jgi:hypothetical protein
MYKTKRPSLMLTPMEKTVMRRTAQDIVEIA